VAAGVVGLIAITTVSLAAIAIPNLTAAAICLTALVVLYRWKNKLTIPTIIAGAGLFGWLCF
jgi:chromate transport protein ChrA